MHAIPDTHCVGSDLRQPTGAGDLWELGLTSGFGELRESMLAWLTSDAARGACVKGVLTYMGVLPAHMCVSWKGFRVANIAECLIFSVEKTFCGSPESAGPWRKRRLWHKLFPQ